MADPWREAGEPHPADPGPPRSPSLYSASNAAGSSPYSEQPDPYASQPPAYPAPAPAEPESEEDPNATMPVGRRPAPVYESRKDRRRREATGALPVQIPTQPTAQPPEVPAGPRTESTGTAGPTGGTPAPDTGEIDTAAIDRAAHARPDPEEDLDHAPEPSRFHPVVLPLMGVLLLPWALTTLVGDTAWGPLDILPVGMASLSPLLAIPALIVITLAVRRRHWVAVVPAAVAAILPWTFMVGYLVPAPSVKTPAATLRAMLVTAQDGSADAHEISVAARAQAADLVVVTEVTAALAHDLTASGLARALPPVYVKIPDEGPASAGIAIYSRFAVDHIEPIAGTAWPAVRARVTIGANGRWMPITLVAGHAVQPTVPHLPAWRTDLRTLGTAAAVKGPVLVLADLNATPLNPQFRRLVSGRLHDAADVFGHGLRPTWPSWSVVPILPADHALTAGLGVTSLETMTISGTDHRALMIRVAAPENSG